MSTTTTPEPDLNQPQNFSDDPVPTEFSKMPEARGSFQPLLQPGTYIFQLPATIELKQFEQYATNDGPRLRLNLREDKALKNVTRGNDPFGTQLNNMETTVGFGEEAKKGNDLAWLVRAVKGTLPDGASNKKYVEELLKHGGKQFKADVELTGSCNIKADVYKDGAQRPGIKGCGQRFAQRGREIKSGPNQGKTILGIARNPDGSWAEGAACKCGAEVRIFANLIGIRSATE